MMNVTKRDGRLEPFQAAKIVKSTQRAGASAATAKRIAAIVKRTAYDGMDTDEIRRTVLEHLNRLDKKAADAYAAYQKSED